ncbi:hypothetical protein [Streptomyces wuyuanensis]|uniref:hypothetical protein n=1 Tax=Streptomyces wuyuanensis TaxID=1196353 RepID=UPI003439ABC7
MARSQRTIENRRHFVLDTIFAEDATSVRHRPRSAGHGHLHNLNIILLRTARPRNIAVALREVP